MKNSTLFSLQLIGLTVLLLVIRNSVEAAPQVSRDHPVLFSSSQQDPSLQALRNNQQNPGNSPFATVVPPS
ncbi:hypothetical protein BDF22DRAFT_681185 [Syncephalis plumigaleata]|nr:hypothetical protein BDF22DRAFT_681185 [Syncephalis plumigaleata]